MLGGGLPEQEETMTVRGMFGCSLALWALAVFVPGGSGDALAGSAPQGAAGETKGAKMNLTLTSTSFTQGGSIPAKYTCEGPDVSPALAWNGVPEGTRSLALIVDDPDAPDPKAPKMTWVHWLLYNLPAGTKGLPEGVSEKDLPGGTRAGVTDYKKTAWGGPCPPIGRHRYFFKLYALDTVLPDLKNPNKAALEKAMEGHILARTELMGTYEKGGR
jgi:Raf kinase inhibitor-like YbhB/YbcL family protein